MRKSDGQNANAGATMKIFPLSAFFCLSLIVLMLTGCGGETVRYEITFESPVSVEQVEELLEESGATFVDYHAMFLDAEGYESSMGGFVLDEEEILTVAQDLSGGAVVSFLGISIVEISCPADSEAEQIFLDSELVSSVNGPFQEP